MRQGAAGKRYARGRGDVREFAYGVACVRFIALLLADMGNSVRDVCLFLVEVALVLL